MKDGKTRKLNLAMNEIISDSSDPTKLNFKMSILDGGVSGNNVIVEHDALVRLGKTVKGMPLVAKLHKNEHDRSKDDFGDHEASLGKDRNGDDYLERDTIAIGSFTSEAYVEKQMIDGVETDVLLSEGVLWISRYPDIVNLIKDMFDKGIKLNTSSEYRYYNSTFNEDGVEVHSGDIYFEGSAVLGSDYNYVAPAYESATFTMLNDDQKDEFNLLVAQALEKEKGEKELPKLKLNNISYSSIMDNIRKQVKESVDEDSYLWISDVFQDYAIVAIEGSDEYKHYKFNYSIENNEVKVDLESKTEVIESREWKTVTNEVNEKLTELNEKVLKLTEDKSDLTVKLEEATTLNAELTETIEGLKPFKEQVEVAQKQDLLDKVKETFETKFNKVDGSEAFASEEIQSLLVEATEDGEVGLNAKLKLNEKVLELASEKLEKNTDTMFNSVKKRDFTSLVKTEEDILKDLC